MCKLEGEPAVALAEPVQGRPVEVPGRERLRVQVGKVRVVVLAEEVVKIDHVPVVELHQVRNVPD